MPEAHILITCPDAETATDWLRKQTLPPHVKAELIAVESNNIYDDEYQFATMGIFSAIVAATAEILVENGIISTDRWPELPAEQWRDQDAYALVHLAVTRWGYLGHNCAEPHLVLESWDQGELRNLGRRAKPDH